MVVLICCCDTEPIRVPFSTVFLSSPKIFLLFLLLPRPKRCSSPVLFPCSSLLWQKFYLPYLTGELVVSKIGATLCMVHKIFGLFYNVSSLVLVKDSQLIAPLSIFYGTAITKKIFSANSAPAPALSSCHALSVQTPASGLVKGAFAKPSKPFGLVVFN